MSVDTESTIIASIVTAPSVAMLGWMIFNSHFSKRWRKKNLIPTGCKRCDGYGYILYPSFLGSASYCECFYELHPHAKKLHGIE